MWDFKWARSPNIFVLCDYSDGKIVCYMFKDMRDSVAII